MTSATNGGSALPVAAGLGCEFGANLAQRLGLDLLKKEKAVRKL
jgi:hypothetical protein